MRACVRACVAWRGMEWHGVAWRGMAWHGVAWRGVAERSGGERRGEGRGGESEPKIWGGMCHPNPRETRPPKLGGLSWN